jgi:hypothetical protein
MIGGAGNGLQMHSIENVSEMMWRDADCRTYRDMAHAVRSNVVRLFLLADFQVHTLTLFSYVMESYMAQNMRWHFDNAIEDLRSSNRSRNRDKEAYCYSCYAIGDMKRLIQFDTQCIDDDALNQKEAWKWQISQQMYDYREVRCLTQRSSAQVHKQWICQSPLQHVRGLHTKEEAQKYEIVVISGLWLLHVEVFVQTAGVIQASMCDDFRIAVLGTPCCPQELHDHTSGDDHDKCNIRGHTDGAVNLVQEDQMSISVARRKKLYLDATLGFRFEVHAHGHIGKKEASDAVPSPRLHPPCSDDEEESPFNTPAPSRIRDDDHGHVYRKAGSLHVSGNLISIGTAGSPLLIDDADDPHHLSWKRIAAGLVTELCCHPEKVEDRVEVY